MKTDINIHMFPARHMVRAVRLAVLSLLLWLGLMPASAQIYSTAQGGTQYKGTYEEAYGSMNNGYYGSMEAQYEYNPYQSNVYKPGSSTPNTGLRKRYTIPSYNPWSDSYAPMRTKKNSPTGVPGGAIGEDEESKNDPEGETGAPDGFITPSDPGHQSNQSPVGEAWVLLFFAAAAALVVFIRQKREKRHIAIYSETQQPSDKSNMKQYIRKSLFISIILLAGVSNAWSADWHLQNNASKIYFSDLTTNWVPTYANSHHIIFLMGRDDTYGSQGIGSQAYDMKYLQNTRLWYYNVPEWGDGDNGRYQYIAFRYATSAWTNWEGNTVTHRATWENSKYTMTRNDNISGKTLFYDPESSATNTNTIVTGYLPKYTATADIKISEDGGNTYAVTHDITLGTLTLTGTYMNGDAATGQSTETTNGTYDYKYEKIPVTGEFTLTNTSVTNAAYEFVGFGTGDKPTINSNSHTWNVTANTTYYAFYKRKQYIINYGVYNSVGGSIKLNSGSSVTSVQSTPINHGTNLTFTITPATGYQIEGWYSNSSCTSKITSAGTSSTYTINNLTAAEIVYVKFKANTYTVTLDPQNGESTNSVTATYGSAMPSITIPTRTGYTFGGYYTSTNGEGTQYYNANGESAKAWSIAANTTLYAKWTAIEYTITYENLGGATHTNPDKYTIEDAITFSEPSARNGYTFAGWSPASIAKGSMGDKTITAQWTEKPANTVYLKAATWWKDNDARTAIWAWKENSNPAVEGWVDVDYDDCTGNILRAEIPAKYDRIKFVRLKPSSEDGYIGENNGYHWGNEWNSTETLIVPTVPTDNKNLYDMTTSANDHLFFQSNSNWTEDGARTAAYFFQDGSGNQWVSMTDIGNGCYYCEKPSGYTKVIFGRMNPGTNENNFNDGVKWNQTGDLTLPTDGKNLYTISGDLDNLSAGTWSTGADNVFDNHRWTTYTAPTFDVTISAATNGTIKVAYKGQTYTSGQTISNVPIHTELNVTFTPAEGYELTTPLVTFADVVADNIYSICGPTVISAEFVQRGSTKVIYLRPNDDWLKDDAIFIAHAWKDGSSDQHDYLMTTKDTDYTGSYSCTIDSKYDHVLFARINPEHKTNQELFEKGMWNKTKDLQITDDVLNANGYRFAIGEKVGGDGENKDHYDGAWEENTPIWGITSDSDNWHAEKAVFMGYPGKLNILLQGGTHELLLYNIITSTITSTYYRNNGTYTRPYSGQWWTIIASNETYNIKMIADVDRSNYLFQMRYTTETGTFKEQLSITYPTTGGYMLAYKDDDSFHPAHYIAKVTNIAEHLDTISFFVHHEKHPEIWLQRHTMGNDGLTKWETIAKYYATGNGPAGNNPNGAMMPGKKNSDVIIPIGTTSCEIDSTGVFNFILKQGNEGANHLVSLDTKATHPYKGAFYIRTDVAPGGWNKFRCEGNKITYSSYADAHEHFDHYFCNWILAGNHIEFTIANDYSYCISDTIESDEIINHNNENIGHLPLDANVRFGWDSKTNEISRAYIGGSGYKKDRFLVLQGNEYLMDVDGKSFTGKTAAGEDRYNLKDHEVVLEDKNNWIYQIDVKATSEVLINLTADFNGKTQYFKGKEGVPVEILESDNTEKVFKIRLIYDFKTNHLVIAWLPDNVIEDGSDIVTDLMLIRRNHGQATQIQFTKNGDAALYGVQIAYGVTIFDKSFLTDANKSQQERLLYWISFPFDVRLKDVFGFGEYGTHWIMEYYDGASRAANGLWADSDTYWKYITNPNYTLKAGTGYVLCLSTGLLNANHSAFDHDVSEISLYFPSAGPIEEITATPTSTVAPEHICTIKRDNRNIYDSNWNLIGVPGYADITGVDVAGSAHKKIQADCSSFYYAYQPGDNNYIATSNTNNFQSLFAYMVQYAGEIQWSSTPAFNPPSPVAAHRTGNMPSEHTLRLELAQGENKADQTIIKLQEQDATADFDMNIDMAKIKNSGANIYTLTENTAIMVAGNALPMEKTTIPVGIEVANAGTYTLRMPDGTDGISVTLIDNQTGIHTDMLLSEYTITLDAGSHLNRFYIAVDPDRTATSVENIGEEAKGDKAKGVEKYLIDGQLFIRTAEGIFDARGQRL